MSGAVGPGDLVTVTHRTHPLLGRRLTVRAVRGPGAGRLLCERPGGGLVTVLPSWTDRATEGRPDQDREPRPETPGPSRPGPGGAAFPVSDNALHRLRAALALSVERFVALDAMTSGKCPTAPGVPSPAARCFSPGEKEKPVSRPMRKS